MDPSALIFVALAVAWAVYLVPKALKHHDEAVRSRSVDKFSHTMRVLARREPIDRRNARLVVAPIRAVLRPPVETKRRTTTPAAAAPVADRPPAARPPVTRESARRAARRRRNVLATILFLNVLVTGLALGSLVAWAWVALPSGLLVAWLVACRLSVKAERAARRAATPRDAIEIGLPPEVESDETQADLPPVPAQPAHEPAVPAPAVPAQPSPESPVPAAEIPLVLSGEIPIVTASVAGGWDMVPTTLPTYVTKPAAQRRTVQTIDLESTGVWSSGRNESDSALAREAAANEKAAAEAEADEKRASGA